MKHAPTGFLTRLLTVVSALLATATATTPTASADVVWSNNPYRIVNTATSGNLVPWGLGQNHADNILIYAWNLSSAGNSWRLVPVEGDYYLLRNTVTNKCIKAGSPYDGVETYVSQHSCSNAYEFQWRLNAGYADPTQFQIVSRSTSQAMRPENNLPNQAVILDTPSASPLNTWSLNPA
ncbi:RICIN domain-containing protein [Streptomyces sp. NPDC012888]|uniref:RICIN domain-containing protein n=1 Tax=Streptomyces sp. NPDC012888 TaxID=3364855 RepID=UPI0036D133C9